MTIKIKRDNYSVDNQLIQCLVQKGAKVWQEERVKEDRFKYETDVFICVEIPDEWLGRL